MLPVFKECVEQLFSRGLVKMVFATETLALGINMPARSVVIDRLSKWNGETHADVTPGEYTQLTGRAGRRGIDVEGHAVVLWAPGFDPKAVAGLASTRTYPLRSSFRPSYNMAVNLVQQVGKDDGAGAARVVVRAVPGGPCRRGTGARGAAARRRPSPATPRHIDVQPGRLHGVCDAAAPAVRRRGVPARQRTGDRASAAAGVAGPAQGRRRHRVPAGRWAGPSLSSSTRGCARRATGPRPLVLTLDRQAKRLSLVDFPTPVEPLLRLRVPKTFNPRNAQQRRELAVVLRDRTRDLPALHGAGRADPGDAEDPEIAASARAGPGSPVSRLPGARDSMPVGPSAT